MGGVSSCGSKKLQKLAHSFSSRLSQIRPPSLGTVVSSSVNNSPKVDPDDTTKTNPTNSTSKTMCAICLEALNYSACTAPGQAIFTAQCSHAFHFDCIASNVRHGAVTCPMCRAQWTHLPRNLKIPPCSYHYGNQIDDPILQILDDSIATFRVHRRSILRSARYDDNDPIEPSHNIDFNVDRPRLHFSILSEPSSSSSDCAYRLCVRLVHQPAIDLVLVACPNGPHLRLIKQSMALVVFSLRPIDRLAVVTYSSTVSRVFPLIRMTSYGKRAALQVIDRLFYMGQADPMEGLKKGVRVLKDRTCENAQSFILHLSDNPTRPYHGFDTELAAQIHRFHVGYSFGTSNGFVMHEFEVFLGRVLGDKVRDIELRIREDGRIVRLGELRGGEERSIPLNVKTEGGNVKACVAYSYVEDRVRERVRTGEMRVVSWGKRAACRRSDVGGGDGEDEDGRSSFNAGSCDYHDPYMARRWAKHLHGYRL